MKLAEAHSSFLLNAIVAPVDAAAAPINTDGSPSIIKRGAAIRQVNRAVAEEEAERVL